MDSLVLTPDLERFAAEAVANGRYASVAEVVATAVHLLRRAEEERSAFIASLDASQAEGERDGFFTIEDLERDMDAAISAARHSLT